MKLLFSHKHTHVPLPLIERMTKCRSQSHLSFFNPGSFSRWFVCETQAQLVNPTLWSRLGPSPRKLWHFLLSALCIFFSKLPTKTYSTVNPTLLTLFPSSNKHLCFLPVFYWIYFPLFDSFIIILVFLTLSHIPHPSATILTPKILQQTCDFCPFKPILYTNTILCS